MCGAKFVEIKNGMEALRGLRYNLQIMGLPLSGPSFAYGYNMFVIHNNQRLKFVLKNKYNSICYHACREAVTMDEMLTGPVQSENSPAGLATNVHGGGTN